MKKLMRKYGGVIFFYTAIILMVWAVNYRFQNLSQDTSNDIAYVEIENSNTK